MSAVFLDTSGWLAAISPRERGHASARVAYQAMATRGVRLVSTALVLGEMHALLLRERGSRDAARFLDAVLASNSITIVSLDTDLVRAAVDRWVHGFHGQTFSLCDAVSFEVMRREHIVEALAMDRHFRVAGFSLVN